MPVSSGPGIGSQMREVRAGWLQLTRMFKITAQCHNDVKKKGVQLLAVKMMTKVREALI